VSGRRSATVRLLAGARQDSAPIHPEAERQRAIDGIRKPQERKQRDRMRESGELTLKVLIRRRHLNYESFCREWDRTARSIDESQVGRFPGHAQYYRWIRGQLVNHRPYPDACRMLEAMFPDWSVESLFSPWVDAEEETDSTLDSPAAPEIIATRDDPAPANNQSSDENYIDVLARIHRLGKSVNPEIIHQLQQGTQDTIAQYETLEHSSIVPVLLKQRAWIDSLLGECNIPGQRQQLFDIASTTSGLLGYIAVGRGDFSLARAYCLEAFQLGGYAEEPNLQSWARGLQSFCEYYAGRYADSLRLAQDGLSYAASGPQSVRLTVNGIARALGKLGDATGVHRAVGQAYDFMALNDTPAGVPSSISLGCYSAAQTASNAATAFVSLGMSEQVQHYIGLALPDISKSESPWSRSLVMIDLGISLIRSVRPDLDRASGLIVDAIRVSAGRPIISVEQRAREFVYDAASRWGSIRQVTVVRDALSTLKRTTKPDE
jgi:hypothetical protein